MRLSDEQLTEIRTRAEAATPGPWFADGDEIKSATVLCHTYDEPVTIAETFFDYADDAFIAYAREDIPKLLAEIERLRGANKALTSIIKLDVKVNRGVRKLVVQELFGDKIEESAKRIADEMRRKLGDPNDGNL